jgi:hypothetical protein
MLGSERAEAKEGDGEGSRAMGVELRVMEGGGGAEDGPGMLSRSTAE